MIEARSFAGEKPEISKALWSGIRAEPLF